MVNIFNPALSFQDLSDPRAKMCVPITQDTQQYTIDDTRFNPDMRPWILPSRSRPASSGLRPSFTRRSPITDYHVNQNFQNTSATRGNCEKLRYQAQ
eukprot:6218747-Amphidinium_carterae.1